jgi:hypothetical protein
MIFLMKMGSNHPRKRGEPDGECCMEKRLIQKVLKGS